MVGTTRRRAQFVAAATGILLAGVLSMPGLAGAQAHDGHDNPSTGEPMTPPGTAPRPPIEIHPKARYEVAPGDSLTMSGGGCKPVEGGRAYVQVALVPIEGNVVDLKKAIPLPPVTEADANGNWSLKITIPADITEGPYVGYPACFRPTGELLDDETVVIIVKKGGEPVTPEVPPVLPIHGNPPPKMMKPPKPATGVKTKPKFTG